MIQQDPPDFFQFQQTTSDPFYLISFLLQSEWRLADYQECNLLEEPLKDVQPYMDGIPVELRPFEIKTWRIHALY